MGSGEAEMSTFNLTKILACPNCLSEVKLRSEYLFCTSCRQKFSINRNIPVLLPSFLPDDIRLTRREWDRNYSDWIKGSASDYYVDYRDNYLEDTLRPIKHLLGNKKNRTYCEIGCGPGILGLNLAQMGYNVTGIDLSLKGLIVAKKLYRKMKTKGSFVCGDILNMPFQDNSLNLIYGGGVIEHFKDTQRALGEIYRVLAKEGSAFLTVPYLSLGALIYRQRNGNIPDIPIIGKIFEFLHVKIFKRKYMTFGYEKSFTKNKLREIFLKAGFRKIKIDFFECHLPFNHFKNEIFKRLLRKVAKLELFRPMVYVIAEK